MTALNSIWEAQRVLHLLMLRMLIVLGILGMLVVWLLWLLWHSQIHGLSRMSI